MLLIKWAQVREREDVVTVGAINYIVGALWIVPQCLQMEFSGDTSAAAVTGGVLGICYFVAYFFVIYAIKWIGAASATVITALSILVPVGCGILIWEEQPSSWQSIGVILAICSLLLVGSRQQESSVKADEPRTEKAWLRPVVLTLFFVLAGTSRLAQEAFKHESDPLHRPVFLASAFIVASIPSVILLAARRRRVSLRELGMGVAMGMSNILQTQFLLQALKSYEGFVVFPVSSAGGLLLITLIATRLLGEKLNRRRTIGIVLASCALVLLNW